MKQQFNHIELTAGHIPDKIVYRFNTTSTWTEGCIDKKNRL